MTCAVGSLASGAGATISIRVRPQATGSLSNTATIGGTEGDPDPTNNTATVTTTVNPGADLRITKTDGSPTYTPGVGLTYTIVATNGGPSDVFDATVVDTFAAALGTPGWSATGTAGTSGFAASGTGNINDSGITIPAGGSVTWTVVVSAVSSAKTGDLVNTATISSDVADPDPTNNTATDTDTQSSRADLRITKTDGSPTYTPGVGLTYTIVATNGGPSDVFDATVVDTFAAALGTPGWSATGTAGTSGFAASGTGNINDSGITIPAGGSVTWTVVVSAVSSAKTGDLVNTATISSDVADPDPTNNTATDTDTQSSRADLRITKTDGSPTYTPGVGLTYTIVATNGGPSDVFDATVVDTFAAALGTPGWSATGTAGTSGFAASGTGNINDSGITIPAGGSVTWTVVVSAVSSAKTGDLVNTATISSDVADPDPTNNTATDTDTQSSRADLRITKGAAPNPVLAGGILTYTLVATNLGPSAATGVTVSDSLPATVTFVDASSTVGSCSYVAPTVTCAVGSLASGAGATISIRVRPQAAGSLSNTATIGGTEGDPDPTNNTATATTTVNPGGDLSVTKTGSVNPAHIGQPLTYTIVVRNDGPYAAANVTLTDDLPKNAGYGDPSTTRGTCTIKPAKRLMTCNLGTIQSGSSVTVTIVIKPTSKGTITNTVFVSAASPPDPNMANNTAVATTIVVP